MRNKLIALLGIIAIFFAACSNTASPTNIAKIVTATGTVQTSSVNSTGAPAGSSAATLEQSVISTIQKVSPAVVEIDVTNTQGSAIGSGSIITPDGYILTNDHVVQGATSISVRTSTQTYTATLKGTDAADDLAIVKITSTTTLPIIAFADSSKVQVGEFVIAVGNPLGIGESATFGIVSATNRSVSEAPNGPANIIPNAIQTSAPINPGNSGGALIDLSGNLVGIPTLGILDPSYGNAPASGIGFAIPANRAQFIANQIIQSGKVTDTGRAYLGVSSTSVTPDIASYNNLSISSGCYVQDVVSGGPAQKAGMQKGDIIYKIDSTTIADTTALGTYLANKSPGNVVTVYVNRNGKNITLSVTLGTLPA